MTEGVPAEQLSDDLLRHELAQLKRMQDEIETSGTDAQRTNHAARLQALETEFVRRHGSESESESESD